MKASENSILRRTGATEAVITWPITRLQWADLLPEVREKVRDLLDEAVDLIELHSHGDGDLGAKYLKEMTRPIVLTPEDEEKVAALLACCHEWKASRVEVETAPVRHICNERKGHKGEHVCSCGAFLA